jgi:hypothetical protein
MKEGAAFGWQGVRVFGKKRLNSAPLRSRLRNYLQTRTAETERDFAAERSVSATAAESVLTRVGFVP